MFYKLMIDSFSHKLEGSLNLKRGEGLMCLRAEHVNTNEVMLSTECHDLDPNPRQSKARTHGWLKEKVIGRLVTKGPDFRLQDHLKRLG